MFSVMLDFVWSGTFLTTWQRGKLKRPGCGIERRVEEEKKEIEKRERES